MNNTGTLLVETGSTIPNAVQFNAGGTLAGFGAVSGTITSTGGIISPGASAGSLFVGNLALNAASTFVAEINGTTPGTTHDQVEATGVITLGGAKLSLPGSFTAAAGTNIVLIENSGGSAVNGNFADLPEGTRLVAGGQMFSIGYVGGSGNDVVLTTVDPVNSLVVSADGRSATFTDDDGDLVTGKLTKGTLAASDFLFAFTADSRQQLQQLTLDAADVGANVTITAKRSANGGTSFTNPGYLSAAGMDLGTVSVDGDLGRIDVGVVKSLTVQSFGALGLTTQAAGGTLVSNLTGNLGKLTVKASIHGTTVLGAGSIAAGDTFGIVAEQITKAKVGKAMLKFDKGERDAVDAFALAATGPGATALASDFFLREAIA